MAARDGSGSSRDEIYGFQPIPRAKWKSVYEVLFGRPLSRPPIGRHLFLLIGRGLRRAPGEVGEEWRRRRRRRAHRKYDGRTRRWDLSGVGTNERRENLSPLFSALEGGCESSYSKTLRADGAPTRCESILPGCAKRSEIQEGDARATCSVFSFFLYLCLDNKILSDISGFFSSVFS